MKKIIISISIIVTVLIVGGFFLYPRLSIIIPTKMFFSKNKTPKAYIIPVERLIKTSFGDIDSISEHSCEWFKFKVPWEIIDTMVLGNSTFLIQIIEADYLEQLPLFSMYAKMVVRQSKIRHIILLLGLL